MVAAATTSLPERLEGGRNYDYRYAWIRDQCYAGLAVAAHGPHPLLRRRGPVRHRAAAGRRPRADARLHGGGRARSATSGRCGCAATPAVPTRGPATGSAASSSSTRWASRCRCSPPRPGTTCWPSPDWRAAAIAADAIEKRWQEPDAGIWELDDRRWTHSRLACVSGLRRSRPPPRPAAGGPGTARRRGGAAWPTRSRPASSDCVHPSGRWQRAPGRRAGGRRPAAARDPGRVRADDPRVLATVEAVRTSWRRRVRVPVPARRPAAAQGRGRVPALRVLDGAGRARAAGTRSRRRTGSSGTGARAARPASTPRSTTSTSASSRGNLPQAFVHAGLLECAVRLSAAPGA
jgi:hypothetical protein